MFFQLSMFMNGTRSWRTPLVPYKRNTKLTKLSWFWLPPAFPVCSLSRFCSFCHITASTVSSTHSKTFWMVPKEVKISKLRLNLLYFHSFLCIAVQIEMPELWSGGNQNSSDSNRNFHGNTTFWRTFSSWKIPHKIWSHTNKNYKYNRQNKIRQLYQNPDFFIRFEWGG